MRVDIVFNGPPGPEAPGFVEVESTDERRSLNLGEWVERDDGYWVLRIYAIPTITRTAGPTETLNEEEWRAYDAAAELANAMHALIGNGSNHSHDWNEVASRIHDLQARIIANAASRAGFPCRPLGV